jgi:hypothetical protein
MRKEGGTVECRKGGGSTLGNRGGERGETGRWRGRGGERERAREPEKMRFVFRI